MYFLLILYLVIMALPSDDAIDLCGIKIFENENPKVKLEKFNVTVIGRVDSTLLERKKYFSYLGIPYAEKPIDDVSLNLTNRFKAPEEFKKFPEDCYYATEFKKPCSQVWKIAGITDYSEDCLYLNIYVPDVKVNKRTKEKPKLPVLIFIIAGGFVGFTADKTLYGPDFLIEKEIIVVTFNHRNDFFGCLSMGTPAYSGNMSLKDQQKAMKFIYENIKDFGGDPEQITISGLSAGGISVSLHLFNEESQKYFKQGMSSSGTGNSPFAYLTGNHVELVRKFKNSVDPSIGDTVENLIDFMKSRTEEQILQFSGEIFNQLEGVFSEVFWPIIENKDAIRPFLQENPEELLKNKPINKTMYFTHANRDMYALLKPPEYVNHEDLHEFLNNYYVQIPLHGYHISLSKKDYLKTLMTEFRNRFYGVDFHNKTDQQIIEERTHIDSDFAFSFYIYKFMEKHAETSKNDTLDTFFDILSVHSTLNFIQPELTSLKTTFHGDDICYRFCCGIRKKVYKKMKNIFPDKESKINALIIHNLSTLISNYVKTGVPSLKSDKNDKKNENVDLKPVTNAEMTEMKVIHITNMGLEKKNLDLERYKYYDEFTKKAENLIKKNRHEPKESVIVQFRDRWLKKEQEERDRVAKKKL